MDLFLHIDTHLTTIIQQYGAWTYILIFLIIFLETGLVVTPFLPGDSLLFVAGTFASQGAFSIEWLVIGICVAAILGDTVNYMIGKHIGPKVFSKENSKLFRKEYLEKTREFYEKYGAKTIILARFVPIVRTFAPFVAGVGSMHYSTFISYNIIGGIVWVSFFTLLGYFFGNLSFIKEHFHSAVIAIIFLSLVPAVIEILKHRNKKTASVSAPTFSSINKTFEEKHIK